MIYEETHELFRDSFRAWVEAELVPHFDEWEAAGIMDRQVYRDAGKLGFLGMAIPERYGGAGVDDFRFNAIIDEELARAGGVGATLGLALHNDMALPYFLNHCDDEQAARWLPGIASGEQIAAIAMTEPGTGSDLASIATTARRDAKAFVVNGSKTFITNGINSDLVMTVCRTGEGRSGLSLLVIERGMPGFERGRNLDKIGQHSADTAEMFFNDVRVPAANLLGEEGHALEYLAAGLPQERLAIAIWGLAAARAALAWTVEYTKGRVAFGQPIADFQNTKFVLAEVATEIEVTQSFVDDCLMEHVEGKLTPVRAAMAKLWATELQNRAVSRCLQLFGGYGYMTEYPISRAFVDARVATIYGGTSEIMKTIIAKDVLGT